MMLLHHEGIIIPLPPDWKLESASVAIAPSPPGEFRPNLVVTSEEILPFETLETFARRVLDSLQGSLADFQLVEQASVAHDYLPVYKREYRFSTPKDDSSILRLRQLQYYVLMDQKIYCLTLSHTDAQFEDVKGFGRVMITRLRIAP